MRQISVSVEVFAAIWSGRKAGEDTEDAILGRLLKVKRPILPVNTAAAPKQVFAVAGGPDSRGGIFNVQFGVTFPTGFEIFRTYKGKRYSAVVKDGQWFMDGAYYPSLHKLSDAVVRARENSWNNWKYRDEKGAERIIDNLRSEETIQRRNR